MSNHAGLMLMGTAGERIDLKGWVHRAADGHLRAANVKEEARLRGDVRAGESQDRFLI